MISVRIHINERQIVDVHAIRERLWAGRNGYHRYNVYETKEDHDTHNWIGDIRHKYSDGGSKLSAKMLYMYDKWVRKIAKAKGE